MTFCSVSDLVLFAATATLFAWHTKKTDAEKHSCPAPGTLKNSAFVFVKPHANTVKTRQLVHDQLVKSGIKILSEHDIDGNTIDKKKLIDQHYYAIASKATILPAKDIPVPKDKFKDTFGEEWDDVLAQNRACNAMEACERFNCTAHDLDKAWGAKTTQVVKFGGGFYCGRVTYKGQTLYVFNAFFMSMRSKFVGPAVSIHCYVVEFDPAKLSWEAFRNDVLGPTDPSEAPAGSVRKTILEQWQSLGLQEKPNKGDNGVHASASPFEGLAEKMNWLGIAIEKDAFGKALLGSGLAKQTIMDWSVDPRVTLEDGSGAKGSVFDALEDMDVDDCLAKLVRLNKVN